MSVNLLKIAVGIQDLDQFARIQQARTSEGFVVHRTRNFPKRKDELLDGSMYWIIKGAITARQSIKDIVEGRYEDGSKCTLIILEKPLIPVVARAIKGFQGWRYLSTEDAPPDQGEKGEIAGIDELPAAMRKELEVLGLI